MAATTSTGSGGSGGEAGAPPARPVCKVRKGELDALPQCTSPAPQPIDTVGLIKKWSFYVTDPEYAFIASPPLVANLRRPVEIMEIERPGPVLLVQDGPGGIDPAEVRAAAARHG
jgi:hypothetical protein